MTLKQVFESMNLTPYDLTIDMLDCHAVGWTYKLIEFLLTSDSAVTNPVFEIQAIPTIPRMLTIGSFVQFFFWKYPSLLKVF